MIKEKKFIKVKELLADNNLKIPYYQRPYKWTVKNVNQLIDDILFFNEKNSYRIGSIIVHEENNIENIVDGQQRTITLLLIAKAILKNKSKELNELKKIYSENEINAYSPKISWTFSNKISQLNIKRNYIEIDRRIKEFDKKTIRFFFEKCEFVKIILSDISEAFQFFDAQNARGKDLEPHDLLKAFHLREMSNIRNEEKRVIVSTWETMVTDELSVLFEKYLFRIRNWSKGYSARFFTKNHTHIFKGINPDEKKNIPFAEPFRITHHFIDNYNKMFERKIDFQLKTFPFQLDTVVLNGKRFFEMIEYYKIKIDYIVSENYEKTTKHLKISKESYAYSIIKEINTYTARYRKGDKYIRNLFNCALTYYVDKFGIVDIEKAIEKFFIWAYYLRLVHHSVQLATIDNYALETNIFKTIRESVRHKNIINLSLKNIDARGVRSTKTESITELFKTLKYYDE